MAAPSLPLIFSETESTGVSTRSRRRSAGGPAQWAMACALLVFPLTAIFHHAVFYPKQCMLNSFGPGYSLSVIAQWLTRDPSLWAALLGSLIVFQIGERFRITQKLITPFLIAFLPLTLWVWDIPLTGRIICHTAHDVQPIFAGFAMQSRYLYMLGGIAYLGFLVRIAQQLLSQRRVEIGETSIARG